MVAQSPELCLHQRMHEMWHQLSLVLIQITSSGHLMAYIHCQSASVNIDISHITPITSYYHQIQVVV